MIIEIEGFDGSGKSSLIKKIMEKYPGRFETYHFPSPEFLDKIHKAYQTFTKKRTLNNLLKYHTIFLEDFATHQQDLASINKPLLLDRYFYSHAAYANADLASFFIHNHKLNKKYSYCKEIMKVFYSFYSELVAPNLVIFLERSPLSNAPEELKTNFFYNLNFKDYAPSSVQMVKALTKSTLPQVLDIIDRQEIII